MRVRPPFVSAQRWPTFLPPMMTVKRSVSARPTKGAAASINPSNANTRRRIENPLIVVLLKNRLSSLIVLEPFAQRREPRRHVRAPEPDPQAILRHGTELGSVQTRGQENDSRLLDQPARELLDPFRAFVANEADAAAVRLAPIEEMRIIGEKCAQRRQVVARDLPVSIQDLVARPERDQRESLGGGRVADGEEMLVALEPDQSRPILAGQPADPQARKSVGLRHHVERYRALVDVHRLRQAQRRIAFDEPIDLVAEQPQTAAAADIDDGVEHRARDDLARGVVGKVDGNQAGVGAKCGAQQIQVEVPMVVDVEGYARDLANTERNGLRGL